MAEPAIRILEKTKASEPVMESFKDCEEKDNDVAFSPINADKSETNIKSLKNSKEREPEIRFPKNFDEIKPDTLNILKKAKQLVIRKPELRFARHAKKKQYSVEWAELPVELIGEIAKQINLIDDFIRFGGVCRSWRSVRVDRRNYGVVNEPWLMLYYGENDGIYIFYRLSLMLHCGESNCINNIFYGLPMNQIFEVRLPEAVGKRCFGSPFGWLITAGDHEIGLLNPLTGVHFDLPSHPQGLDLNKRPKCALEYAVLSSSPSSITSQNDCIVIALFSYNDEFAFARVGDKSWTSIGECFVEYPYNVMCFRGQLYTVNGLTGVVLVCDVNCPNPKFKKCVQLPGDNPEIDHFYLVEISGELHVVRRYIEYVEDDDDDDVTEKIEFDVYKLDCYTRTITKVLEFEEYALLLGPNFSISCPPKFFQGNCIYFIDTLSKKDGAFVYDYKKKSSMLLDKKPGLYSRFTPWFIPSLW